MTIWDDARATWDDAVAAVNQPIVESPVRVKSMLSTSLLRATVPIAITGLRGAGKTLLYDALTGRVGTGYIPPDKSNDVEAHHAVISTRKKHTRAGLVVVPGQESHERGTALERMFTDGAYPAGIIHVVCWGHNKIWDSATVGAELRTDHPDFSEKTVRLRNLAQESRDFAELCGRLRNTWTRKSGVWMIVAIAKCDLYWPSIDDARRHYLPGEDNAPSDFQTSLRNLLEHVGYGNFAGLSVLPVSCYPESHEFDPTLPRKKPELDLRQATALVHKFQTVLGEFCERRDER